MRLNYVAPCLFGVEGLLSNELKRMGIDNVEAQNGRVLFSGGSDILVRANICSRLAERILINLGEFNATSFSQLFDNVKALPWERFIGKKDAFPVKGWSINSQLYSIPDCQSIIKKAIVERLKQKYKINWFEESGTEYKVRFSILKNHVTLMIDTSGEGLHKRGYRRDSNQAPLKETLAAAMAEVARIYPDTLLVDPFCGSGTILIESAMIALNMAPGLKRRFSAENFGQIPRNLWKTERERALSAIKTDIDFRAIGYDIDSNAVGLTLTNAQKAGVERYVSTKVQDIKDFEPEDGRMLVITNPPYGERLLDIKEAEQIYTVMGKRFFKERGKKYYIISPHDEFEKLFGRPADKRRKVYNGMIKCQIYMYYK